MKTLRLLVATWACVGTVWANGEAGSMSLAVKLEALAPTQSEDWDSGGGLEAQLRFWNPSGLGVALALGYQSWNARTDFAEILDELGYASSLVEGDASAVPLGASVLYRSPLVEGVGLTLEAGLRYLLVSSNLRASVYAEDATGSVFYEDPIDIEDSLVGLLRLNLDIEMTRSLALEAGLGYQIDLGKPHETYLGADIGATSFEAASLNVGLVWKF